MNTQTAKTEVMNNIIVAMSYVLNQNLLEVLEKVITEEFVKVNIEEITTLPAAYVDEVDEKNEYIIRLFIIKKKKLARGTMENYLRAVKMNYSQVSRHGFA